MLPPWSVVCGRAPSRDSAPLGGCERAGEGCRVEVEFAGDPVERLAAARDVDAGAHVARLQVRRRHAASSVAGFPACDPSDLGDGDADRPALAEANRGDPCR